MGGTLPLILAALQLGGSMATQLISSKRINQWIEIGLQAAAGVQAAIDAKAKIESWHESGYNPSDEELDQVLQESSDLHLQIQDA